MINYLPCGNSSRRKRILFHILDYSKFEFIGGSQSLETVESKEFTSGGALDTMKLREGMIQVGSEFFDIFPKEIARLLLIRIVDSLLILFLELNQFYAILTNGNCEIG